MELGTHHTAAGSLSTCVGDEKQFVSLEGVSTFGGMEWWNGILEYRNGIATCAELFFSCV